MAKKTTSSTVFWMRHIGLTLALVVIAALVVTFQNMNISAPKPEGGGEKKDVSKGVSEFYAAYRMSSTKPYEEDIGDFVMSINTDKRPLADRLKSMESLQKPISERWVGEHKYRSFKAGSTIREAITGFAQTEGMQVIWELDKDFIIKHQFQMDSTVTSSLGKIAKAIDGSFEGEVVAFICPKQRSLVITATDTGYLLENCSKIN